MPRRTRRKRWRYERPTPWTTRLTRLLKLGWWAVCVGTLAGWWLGWGFVDGAGHRVEHRQLLDAVMGVIAFPAGLLWVWISPAFEPLIEPLIPSAGIPPKYWTDYGPELFAWLGAAVIGHIQWFWLVPYVFRARAAED